jgi:Zn-dependent protease
VAFTLFHVARVPVRLHWSVLVGLFVFSGLRIDPVGWVGVLGLILAHEIGHALVVRWAGGRATAIELTGFGGLCRWEGDVSPIGRAAIAWGGIWAQLLVLGVATAWEATSEPGSYAAFRLLSIATFSNVWMIGFNLLPVPPLDGAEAWRLPVLLGRALRRRVSSDRDAGEPPRRDEAPDDGLESGTPEAEAARSIAAQLLEEARRPEDHS